MGLFGPKIAKEEKMYQKVLKNALNKPNRKNIEEMEQVLSVYPTGWQGYWICGVYYDQGFHGDARNEKKAQECFEKAMEAAAGTEQEIWMREFLTWYRKDAGNLERPISENLERGRRLGIAMCYCSLLGENYLTGSYEKYGADNYTMYKILGHTDMDFDEKYAFTEFMTVPTFDRNEQVKSTNSYFKKARESGTQFSKCIKAVINGQEPCWDKYYDMYNYFIAVNCIHGGKLLTAEAADQSDYLNETEMGLNKLISAVYGGCQPAIHELVRLAYGSEENYEVVKQVYECNGRGKEWRSFHDFLVEHLEKCIKKNDTEAKHLYQMFFIGQ